jgi:acetyl-CoA C-acetyltransferase
VRLCPETPPARRATGRVPNAAAAVIVVRKSFAVAHGLPWLAEICAYASTHPAPADPGSPLALSPVRALERALTAARVTASALAHTEVDRTVAARAEAALRAMGGARTGRPTAPAPPSGASGPRTVLRLAQALGRHGGGLGAAAGCDREGRGEALLLRVRG